MRGGERLAHGVSSTMEEATGKAQGSSMVA